MGFIDKKSLKSLVSKESLADLAGKAKDVAHQLKEENRNLGKTTRRINNTATLYGCVNAMDSFVTKTDPNDDFPKGSYISIENEMGVIYAPSIDDYVFSKKDIKSFVFANETPEVHIGSDTHIGMRFMIEFNDGKKAKVDIIVTKLDRFKETFGL